MSCYGYLALLIYKWNPSQLGSHSLGFPPPRNLPPTLYARSPKMISTSYPNIVDLVKLDLVQMQMPLFTHEGVKSSSYDDPFSHYEGFYSYFWNVWASLPIYLSPKWNQQKINIPISCMLILEYYTRGAPNAAWPLLWSPPKQVTLLLPMKFYL